MLKKMISIKNKIFWKSWLIHIMPEIYFKVMDKKDFYEHEIYLNKILDPDNHIKSYHQISDNEEFCFYNYDLKKLKNKILKVVSESKNDVLMYRLFPNKENNFILATFYENIDKNDECFKAPSTQDFKKVFLYRNNRLVKHVDMNYHIDKKNEKTMIILKCVNVAHNTLISNIFETIQRHKLYVDYMQVWQINKFHKKIKSYYEVTFEVDSIISETELLSIKDDFSRYIQLYIKSMSIFDMVWPAMVWPSSSHTAWANRIWQIARNIMLATIKSWEKIQSVEVKLIWSFRDTWVWHKTPTAIWWWLCWYDTNDKKMIEAWNIDSLLKNWINFWDQIAKFSGFKKWTSLDDEKYSWQKSANIAEINFKTNKWNHTITWVSIWAWNVEIRFFDQWLDFPLDGKFDTVLHNGKIQRIDDTNSSFPKISKIYHEKTVVEHPMMPFHTFEELIEYVNTKK